MIKSSDLEKIDKQIAQSIDKFKSSEALEEIKNSFIEIKEQIENPPSSTPSM